MTVKDMVLKTLLVPGVTAPFGPLLRDRATLFVLHRFRDRERDVEGLDPAVLEEGLSYLRRHGCELLELDELLRRLLGEGPPLRRAVAFTIDDGYLDQATIAAPIFARYDCPVTMFVVTGFLDRKIWLWWDQIEYIFLSTRRREVQARLDGIETRYSWTDDAGRRRAQWQLNLWCTRQPQPVVDEVIAAVACSAEVEIPADPPPPYLPMTWDLVRSCQRQGMKFGPHTVTHPILSLCSDEQSLHEISESWNRLRSEIADPVPVFCYPNGRLSDFGLREIATLQELGFLGAVRAEEGYADARVHRVGTRRFSLPRFGYPYDQTRLIQIVSGVERLKRIVRREVTA